VKGVLRIDFFELKNSNCGGGSPFLLDLLAKKREA